MRRRARPGPLCAALAVSSLTLVACATWSGSAPAPAPTVAPVCAEPDAGVYQRAERERAESLAREVSRLREDLHQAEEAMASVESGLRGTHTRADAVSAVAEARIAVERAARNAPWRPERILEARAKFDEAERQLQADHPGAAVFFASRARRIAEMLSDEAQAVERAGSARFVTSGLANLRAGPSTAEPVLEVLTEQTPVFAERSDGPWTLVRTLGGEVGWIHASLLRTP